MLDDASGFLYYVSIAGITGTQLGRRGRRVAAAVARLKQHTDLPVAVGFGIRTPEQAAAVARVADAAVVGSALVDRDRRQLDAEGRGRLHGPVLERACSDSPCASSRRASALMPRRQGAAMNWLTNFVRPKHPGAGRARPTSPDNLWAQMPGLRPDDLPPRARGQSPRLPALRPPHAPAGGASGCELLFDDGTYERIELPKSEVDPLQVPRPQALSDRLQGGRSAKTGAAGRASSSPQARSAACRRSIAAFNFDFMGGSMGMRGGRGADRRARRLAVLQEAPLIVVPASGGARMQEGILSLMQMPRTIIAVDDGARRRACPTSSC